MKFTGVQLRNIHLALTTEDGKEGVRTFPLEKQTDAASIAKKLFECLEEKEQEVEREGKKEMVKFQIFKDAELEFSTEEKALILDCLKRDWDLASLQMVAELRDLLK